MRQADATRALTRALMNDARKAGLTVEVVPVRARPWASATFEGERVQVELRTGACPGEWLTGLPEADLPMRGWFVADLSVLAEESTTLEALLLRDA